MSVSEEDQPPVSCIVVTRNTREMTLRCLESVVRSTPAGMVQPVVVDNASRDGTAEEVARRFPQAQVIRNQENAGFGRANNLGAAKAEGRCLFLLNSDTLVTDGCIQRLLGELDADEKLGAVAPRLTGADGQPQKTADILPDPIADLFPAVRRRRRWRVCLAAENGQPLPPEGYLGGAALMVRRSAFEQIGGFDQRFFFYHEDADLSFRLAQAGWSLRVCPQAEVVHLGGGSARSLGTAASVEMIRSRLQFLLWRRGRTAAFLSGIASVAGHLRRAASAAVLAPFSPRHRERLRTRAGVLLWFAMGLPDRDAPVYRRLLGDWRA